MAQDIQALNTLFTSTKVDGLIPESAYPALRTAYDQAGPDLPKDLVETPVKCSLDQPVCHYNYDEGHAGRMSVPDTSGGSVSFDKIINRSNPESYIAQNLTFYPPSQQSPKVDYIVTFVPGLNTFHEPKEGETTTVERLIHYTKVLNFPLSQIHLGTSLDQGKVIIPPEEAKNLIPALKPVMGSLPGNIKPKIHSDGSITWHPGQIDSLQIVLSRSNHVDIPVKKSIRSLIKTIEEPSAKPITLLGYSRGSMELEAALRQYVKENPNSFDLLREYVTVLTIGNSSREWPDGPCYIHLSSYTDSVTISRGVSESKPEGAGKDAVFLHCDTPYNDDAFDNHNFGSITSQFLSIVMAASKATSFRDLWKKAQSGNMVIPKRVNEATRAMIQLTDGFNWLWSPEEAWKDIAYGALPNEEKARATIREIVGDEFVDAIVKNYKE